MGWRELRGLLLLLLTEEAGVAAINGDAVTKARENKF